MKGRHISYECMETIAQWVSANCCVLLTEEDGREFVRGLYFIVEEEVKRALTRERDSVRGRLRRASKN
jgi:hypothetical protein